MAVEYNDEPYKKISKKLESDPNDVATSIALSD